jgi:hypothetical protein
MDNICASWTGVLLGGVVGVGIVCAIEVIHGLLFEHKLNNTIATEKQWLLWEVKWRLQQSGMDEEHVQDILDHIEYRWCDEC